MNQPSPNKSQARVALSLVAVLALAAAWPLTRLVAELPTPIRPNDLATLAQKLPWGSRPIIVLRQAQVVPAETAELEGIYTRFNNRLGQALPGEAGGEARVTNLRQFRSEMAAFATTHSNSAYAPGAHLRVGQMAQSRMAYGEAIDHLQQAYLATSGLKDPDAQQIAAESAADLASLLVNTGRHDDQINLEKDVSAKGINGLGPTWGRAVQRRQLLAAVPEAAYKCGIYCTVLLARQVQPGDGDLNTIRETTTTPAGLSAADLTRIARGNGIWIQPIRVEQFKSLPIPCIVHLNSDHFVFVTSQVGGFYHVLDSAAPANQMAILPEELSDESSGVVLVPEKLVGNRKILSMEEADKVRGRCHTPNPDVDEDHPHRPHPQIALLAVWVRCK